MTTVEMTYQRSVKVWWSYTWRLLLLLIPVSVVLVVANLLLMLWIAPLPPRAVPLPHMMHSVKTLYAVVPFGLLVAACAQIIALRWALRVRWSEFRLDAVTGD
jgi:hypothetical protein